VPSVFNSSTEGYDFYLSHLAEKPGASFCCDFFDFELKLIVTLALYFLAQDFRIHLHEAFHYSEL